MTTAHTLHRLTSYEPSRDWSEPVADPRVLQNLTINELDKVPWFVKRYDGDLPRVDLPRDLPAAGVPALDVLAGTAEIPAAAPDLAQLSRVLYLCAGVVRTSQRPWGRVPFRAAGSAGGRFPLEVYVAVPDGGPLPSGVHWYDPSAHALVQVGPPPRGAAPAVVVTGVPWRTGWRYRERGYRHIFWDLGTMLSQLLAAAGSAGLGPALHSRFPDDEVARLVGADGVHEFPVAVVALGGAPALTPSGAAAPGAVDAAPREFPLVTAARQASRSNTLGRPWPSGAPVEVDSPPATPLDEVVLTRGSQRLMDPARGLSSGLLQTSMSVALRGIDLPHYVAVHDVTGVAPGLYRWPDLQKPIQAGDLRAEMFRISLDQELTRDAAFVVITAADVPALDDAGYREAQLAAGLVEGRLHLLAYALGASATGMTFIDSEIPGLLGEPLEAMLFTCVGVPAYRASRGGRPGNPTEVGLIQPR
ncbi:nitroreductase family protein [Paractinoplanes rishiriensis]|uniref:Nitroreductase domain-containing protein n=1 Tax=Paractinoplanes rishiriensis TaxID=1050105 RepID=A0A919N2J7_9ACTN|nr:nitroreductase family protein [Actinoplanes rishiriensis]GIF00493.1 hypothetical protein Ari01nite_79570 [Actinoplanes rishiriensis]